MRSKSLKEKRVVKIPTGENLLRLIEGLDKQHALVEELGLGYFTQGKYIGDQKFLVEAAAKVGIEGAEEFLKNPNNGLKE
ncbi:DSBA-like thioredoxin domain containing protein, partial [Trifolium medium]|nr:DSBA-like thioredoxin domain containing protein [Trifolium medium]